MVSSGVLVLSMNAAFALLEAGAVHRKNLANILMKNICDLTLGGVVWWLVGYRLAFRPEGESWLAAVNDDSFWFLQWGFAATAATINSGAMAERCNFLSYCVISVITTGLIYPFAAFLAWHPDGYLSQLGFRDFAGGCVVHMLGGVQALVSVFSVGPRIGRFHDYMPSQGRWSKFMFQRSRDPDYYMLPAGQPPVVPITDPLSSIWGVFFLWIGWYGFNTGNVPEIEGYGTYLVGRVAVNTTLGALAGAFTAMLKMLVFDRAVVRPEGLGLGVLAGLVSITAGVPFYSNGSSFCIGMVGTLLAMAAKTCMERLRIDDVVAAFPIHGAAGLFGTIAIGLWSEGWECSGDARVGVFYAGEQQRGEALRQLGVQAWGCAVVGLFTVASTLAVEVTLNQIPCLRIRSEHDTEISGLDESEHDVAHEELFFNRTLFELMERIAGSEEKPEDIVEAFKTASRHLHMAQEMKTQLNRFHARRRQSDVTLRVHVTEAEGLPSELLRSGITAWAGRNKPGIKVRVEIISGMPPPPGKPVRVRKGEHYMPRKTSCAPVVGPDSRDANLTCRWSEIFAFPQFFLPTGCEYSTLFVFSICVNGSVIGQCNCPLAEVPWVQHGRLSVGGEIECSHILPIVPIGKARRLPRERFENARLRVDLSCSIESGPRVPTVAVQTEGMASRAPSEVGRNMLTRMVSGGPISSRGSLTSHRSIPTSSARVSRQTASPTDFAGIIPPPDVSQVSGCSGCKNLLAKVQDLDSRLMGLEAARQDPKSLSVPSRPGSVDLISGNSSESSGSDAF